MLKRFIAISLFFIPLGLLQAQVFYRAVRLDMNSTSNNEMAPAIYKGGLVFSSNRKNDVIFTTFDQEGNYTYDLYFTRQKSYKNWSDAEIFSKELTTRYNESSVCFNADGQSMFYTANISAASQTGDANGDTLKNGIYMARLSNNTWVPDGEFPYNSTEYDIGYPCLSEDGNRLYFSSRDPSGQGNYDIYYSDYVNNSWTRPMSVGPLINTGGSEVFPFIYKKNRLYFSSDQHGSQGGLDIFYSDLVEGEWSKPVALPRPFNSRNDDFSLVANEAMDTGYFTSNRRGSDDIYTFISAFPAFPSCPEQVDETFCYDFYEKGTMDLDTTSLRYEWDLGDGTRVRKERVSHCYEEPGYYLVQLNVIDTLTGEVFFSEAAYDLNIEPIEQPYMLAPDTIRVNESVSLDASESQIRSFAVENYYWDFGDGVVETEMVTRHQYQKTGTYIVRLGLTGKNEDEPDGDHKACASKQIVVIPRR
ncbi:MAG: PKD domain-containing protein [Bacteroidales bacterium]|nr:PKD domain-containing protein [Bacteroidales bacterium]